MFDVVVVVCWGREIRFVSCRQLSFLFAFHRHHHGIRYDTYVTTMMATILIRTFESGRKDWLQSESVRGVNRLRDADVNMGIEVNCSAHDDQTTEGVR